MPTAPTWEGRRQVTLSAAFAADPSGLPRRVRPLGVGGRPFPSGCLCSLPCGTGQNAAMWLEVTRQGRVPEGDRKLPFQLRTCPLPWRFSVLGWGSRTSALRSCQVPTFRAVTASRGLPRPTAPCCDPRCGLRQPLQARVAWRNRGPSLRFPLLLVSLFLVNTVGSCFGVPSDCFNFDQRFPLPPCPCPFVVRGRWFPHLTCNWRSPRTTRFALKCNSVVFSAAAALGNEHNVL